MASSSKSYGISGDNGADGDLTIASIGEPHYIDEELRKRRPSDPSWNNEKYVFTGYVNISL